MITACPVCGRPKETAEIVCRDCFSTADQRTRNMILAGGEPSRQAICDLKTARKKPSRTTKDTKEKQPMSDELIVPNDSPEAAVCESRTLTGWWSRTGHFYGENEHVARYDGCTHRRCACGNLIPKKWAYTVCRDCWAKKRREEYAKLERREWRGEPLAEYDGDRYFWSWEELTEAAADGTVTDETLLVIAEPVFGPRMDADDFLSDYLPEEGEAPDSVVEAVKALNQAIQDAGPLSYRPGKVVPIFSQAERDDLAGAIAEGRKADEPARVD